MISTMVGGPGSTPTPGGISTINISGGSGAESLTIGMGVHIRVSPGEKVTICVSGT